QVFLVVLLYSFFFRAEDGIRVFHVTGVQTCALPISANSPTPAWLTAGRCACRSAPSSGVSPSERLRRSGASLSRPRSTRRRTAQGPAARATAHPADRCGLPGAGFRGAVAHRLDRRGPARSAPAFDGGSPAAAARGDYRPQRRAAGPRLSGLRTVVQSQGDG